jgi:hypothetical protein
MCSNALPSSAPSWRRGAIAKRCAPRSRIPREEIEAVERESIRAPWRRAQAAENGNYAVDLAKKVWDNAVIGERK